MASPEEDLVLDDDLDPERRDLEASPADAVEQATPAAPADRHQQPGEPPRRLEVSEYDAVEQTRVVDVADDY